MSSDSFILCARGCLQKSMTRPCLGFGTGESSTAAGGQAKLRDIGFEGPHVSILAPISAPDRPTRPSPHATRTAPMTPSHRAT